MRSDQKQILLAITVLLTGFSAVFGISSFLERSRITLPPSYSDSDLDLQGKKLKGFALGAEGLISDWYWMRSLQYLGGKFVDSGEASIDLGDLRPLNPRLLYPLLDIATELDPKSMAPFSFGATILPAIDPQQAIALVEKGIEKNPDEWRLYQHLGYIYWRLKEYEKAASIYEKGGQIPGAPPFFKLMAAKMRGDGGSRDAARAIYSQMLNEAPDRQTQTSAQLRLHQLDALDQMELINPVLGAFRERTGRCISNWPEILPSLQAAADSTGRDLRVDAKRNLVDPSGVPYRINSQKCEVEIDWPTSKIPIN